MDAAGLLDREGHDVARVALHQPFVAFLNLDDVVAGEARTDRRCADHAVDSGSGSAADEDAESILGRHGTDTTAFESASLRGPRSERRPLRSTASACARGATWVLSRPPPTRSPCS